MRVITLVIALLTMLAWAGGAPAAEQTFGHPKQGKNLLDYCYSWQEGCGQPAADAYCVAKGFENASAFEILKGIGDTAPTRTIGDNSVCDNAGCDGFASITCTKVTELVYSEPEVDGVRVDWCYGWSKGCGKPAADAYCQSEGYAEAKEFDKAEGVGPTRVLSTGQLCDDPTCDGFESLTCTK